MPLRLRLAIVLAAAIMVGAVNQRYLSNRLKVEQFIAVRAEAPLLKPLQEGNLYPVSLSGDLSAVRDLLVPWEDRQLYVGVPPMREQPAGSLIARRDVELEVMSPYAPAAGEMVFSTKLPKSLGLTRRYNIGSQFRVVAKQTDPTTHEERVHELGPFTLRQIGALSKRIDPALLAKLPSTEVTLSIPDGPNGSTPVDAINLLEAVKSDNGWRLFALIDADD